jgi:hypothetical protein
MAVLASDVFTRANENPLASPWVTPTGAAALQLVSNSIGAATASTDAWSYYSGVTWPDDQYVEWEVTTIGGRDGGGVVRMQSGSLGGYHVNNNSSSAFEIFKVVGGGFTSVANVFTAAGYQLGLVYRLEVVGNVITFKESGVTLLTYTDTTSPITSGNAGLGCFDGTIRLDNWVGGDFGAGGSTTKRLLTLGIG